VRRARRGDEQNRVEIEPASRFSRDFEMRVMNWIEGAAEKGQTPSPLHLAFRTLISILRK